jgi:hypothetical protein
MQMQREPLDPQTLSNGTLLEFYADPLQSISQVLVTSILILSSKVCLNLVKFLSDFKYCLRYNSSLNMMI